MNEQESLTLWIGSTRYYLGRMSYAVSDFCELLIKNWHSMPENLKVILQRDIEEQFELDDRFRADGQTTRLPLGMDCDRASWEQVRKLWKLEIKNE